MRTIVKNIKEIIGIREEDSAVGALAGDQMKQVGRISDAYLMSEFGRITGFGPMSELPEVDGAEIFDAKGGYVFPAFVDSHTHLVFAETREAEFEQRLAGLTYQEIAEKGGGILNSARKLGEMSEEDLYHAAAERLTAAISNGVGAIEIKSGYGLTMESELKMLKVIKRLKENFPIPIKATYLGAHALPTNYANDLDGYLDQVCGPWLDAIAEEHLADYIDVFCEQGYFDADDAKRVIQAGKKHGLNAKIHTNQFNSIGGLEIAMEEQILSIDHLEVLGDHEIDLLKKSSLLPVALPSCSFFLGIPYTPGRKIIDAGLPLVIASDHNPGSTPSGNMWFLWSLACIRMKLTPEEALTAMTMNGAAALELDGEMGSITVGKRANFIVTKPRPSFAYLPYSFGEGHIEQTYIDGRPFSE